MKNKPKTRITCPTKFSSFIENSDALTRLLYLVKTNAEENLGKGTKLSEYLDKLTTIQNKQRDEIREKTLSEIKKIADILSKSNDVKTIETNLQNKSNDNKIEETPETDDVEKTKQEENDTDSSVETVKLSPKMKSDPNIVSLFEKDQNQ